MIVSVMTMMVMMVLALIVMIALLTFVIIIAGGRRSRPRVHRGRGRSQGLGWEDEGAEGCTGKSRICF